MVAVLGVVRFQTDSGEYMVVDTGIFRPGVIVVEAIGPELVFLSLCV